MTDEAEAGTKLAFEGGTILENARGYLSGTDLVRLINSKRIAVDLPAIRGPDYYGRTSTRSYMDELDTYHGGAKVDSVGKGYHTWLHPLLFIDMALEYVDGFKTDAYPWLIKKISESQRELTNLQLMCGTLYLRTKNKEHFATQFNKVRSYVQSEDGDVEDTYGRIALLGNILKSSKEAVRLGLVLNG